MEVIINKNVSKISEITLLQTAVTGSFLLFYAITHNFPFPHSSEVVNDLSINYIPVVLRYEVGEFKLGIFPVLSVNWEVFGHVLKNMDMLRIDMQLRT